MEKLYSVSKNKTESWLCSDHELLIAKLRLKLKKVGETTRSFRYELNQIPYYYTVEVTNRVKGLDLIDRVPEELWKEVHDIAQEAVIKIIPKKKKYQNAKWLSDAAAAKSPVVSDSIDPIDGIPPGSSVPGILQARTLEWVSISFSSCLMRPYK